MADAWRTLRIYRSPPAVVLRAPHPQAPCRGAGAADDPRIVSPRPPRAPDARRVVRRRGTIARSARGCRIRRGIARTLSIRCAPAHDGRGEGRGMTATRRDAWYAGRPVLV